LKVEELIDVIVFFYMFYDVCIELKTQYVDILGVFWPDIQLSWGIFEVDIELASFFKRGGFLEEFF
jgi:hypothetical protein